METQTKPYSKEEVKEILSQIDEKLNDYLKSGRYKDVLMMMGNLGNYSLTNQIYILLQNPEATHVAGMKGWNYLGRSVKKGEKALRIFAPIKGKKTDELTDGEGHAVLDENGNKITRTYDIVKGFKPSYVWDISQTSGREIKPLKFGEMPSQEEHDIIMKGLTETVKTIGFQVEYANKLIEGVDNAFIQDKKMKASLAKQAKSENIQVPPTKQQHCEMEAC